MCYTVAGRVIEYLSEVDPLVAANVSLVIVTGIYVIFTGQILLIMVREKERPMILDMAKNFVIPVKNALNSNQPLNETYFPSFLTFTFCIPPNLLEWAIFGRFAKRNRLLKWNILRYQKLCSEFKKKFEEFKKEAKDKGVVEFSYSGRDIVNITVQYEDKEITKILAETGLDEKIENIKEFRDQLSLDKKAKKLIDKLEKLISNYQDKYYLTDDDLSS